MTPLSRARPAPVTLVRHPDFLKLWSAETISQLGSQVSQLAIPFVALGVLNASTFEIALLNVVEMLPFLLVGLVAGVWVDRLRRRPILVAADLGRAALLATIPLAYSLNALTIIQLYVVGAAVGLLTVFFDVAYRGCGLAAFRSDGAHMRRIAAPAGRPSRRAAPAPADEPVTGHQLDQAPVGHYP